MKKITIQITALMSVIYILSITVSAIPSVNVSNEQIINIGETNISTITLSDAPNGLSGYNLTVSISNKSTAEITAVEFPDWAVMKANGNLPSDSVWIKAADLNDNIKNGASNLVLAKLIVKRINNGSINFGITITKMDDDTGNPIYGGTDTRSTTSITPASTPGAAANTTPGVTANFTPGVTVASAPQAKTTPASTSEAASNISSSGHGQTAASTPAPTGSTPAAASSPKEHQTPEAKTPGFMAVMSLIGLSAALIYYKRYQRLRSK